MLPTTSELLLSQPFYTACYGFLAAAIISLWLREGIFWWSFLLLTSMVIGFLTGILELPALIVIVLYWFFSYLAYNVWRPRIRMCSQVVVLVMTMGILLHYYQGFDPWVLIEHLQLGHRAIPFTHFIFYEHAVIGVCLIGMGAIPLIRRYPDWVILFRDTWPIVIVAMISLFCLSYFTAAVDIDFEWSHYYKTWAITNLIFVCIAEEAIFRGMFQRPLTALFSRWIIKDFSIGLWCALVLTTLFYVLRHIYAGPTVMVYSMITGFFYGYAYMKTRRIESAIIVHFAINSMHFLSFTYPMLA